MQKTLLLTLFIFLFGTLALAQNSIPSYKLNAPSKVEFQKVETPFPLFESKATDLSSENSLAYLEISPNQHAQSVKRSSYEVNYQNFPNNSAVRAFEYALSILEELFPSSQTIRVDASFTDLPNNILLRDGPTNFYYINSFELPYNTFYPVALAEKLFEGDLNDPTEADITIIFDNSSDWYYNYQNPRSIGNRYDFVTNVLKSMIRSMGFLSTIRINEGLGYAFFNDSTLNIYDRFVELRSGDLLAYTFPDVSPEMANAIQSDDLYFGSPYFQLANTPEKPKLYAPSPYNGGNLSFLNPDTFEDTDNDLLTPFLFRGKVTHDPGIALQMMYDMGWSHTRPIPTWHSDPAALAHVNQEAVFNVEIAHDFGYDPSTVMMHYYEGEYDPNNVTSISLAPVANADDLFIGTLPALDKPGGLNVFFSVEDDRGVTKYSPYGAPRDVYYIVWGSGDTLAPNIAHVPENTILESEPSLRLTAHVSDINPLESVIAILTLDNSTFDTLSMQLVADTFSDVRYETVIPMTTSIRASSAVNYKIIAADIAQNVSCYPMDCGFQTVAIQRLDEPVMMYMTDFNNNDALSNFSLSGFTIGEDQNLSDGSLASVHPYADADSRGVTELEHIAHLLNPIVISSDNPTITFDEIVLVEPADLDASPEAIDFWDYVTIEAQKWGGQWMPLTERYDSRKHSSWLEAFEAGYNNDSTISSAAGQPSLYQSDTIDLTASGAFSADDTINLRFRLHSDPIVVGWGWSIDNLIIQEERVTTSALNQLSASASFEVFPNPSANGRIKVSIQSNQSIGNQRVNIFNLNGTSVFTKELSTSQNESIHYLDVSHLPTGVYFLQAISPEGQSTRKLILQ